MVSAVLFAKDLRKVASFYTRVLSAQVVHEDAHPPWAGDDTGFRLGYDPEGNVFGAQST